MQISKQLLKIDCLSLYNLKWNIVGKIKAMGVDIADPAKAITFSNLPIDIIPIITVNKTIEHLNIFCHIYFLFIHVMKLASRILNEGLSTTG